MSNTAYLCCNHFPDIYPNAQAKGYKPQQQTVACAVEHVPLLWMALFRKSDLQTAKIETDDGVIIATAPVTSLEQGLKQLAAAATRLEEVFSKNGPLHTHAALLEKALRGSGGKYVTIELDEIAALASSRKAFDQQLRDALQSLASGSTTDSKKRLVKLTHVDARRPFIAPAELMAQKKPTTADLANLECLLGTAHFRDVPWETVPKPKKAAPGDVKRQSELLIDAIMKGNAAKARQAIEAGANPNAKGNFQRSALAWAAEKGNVEIVKLLLEAGAATKSDEALVCAASEGHTAIVQLLLKHKASAASGEALAVAAAHGAEDCVKLLLTAGSDLNFRGDPPGHVLDAVAKERLPLSCLSILVRAGADPNQSKALPYAAARGNLELVKALVKQGADIEKKRYGVPPIADAGYSGHLAIVRFLVEAGTSPAGIKLAVKHTRDAIASDAKVVRKKPDKEAEKLLKARQTVLAYLESLVTVRKAPLPGPEPDSKDVDAIYRAIMKDDTAKVNELLDRFPKIMNKFAWTPMFELARKGRIKMLQFLLERRLNPNERNAHGNTPLHFAAQYKQPAAVALLLKHGANPKLKDQDGDTPLSLAKGEVKELLSKHVKAQ
jgi:ankyrin repeat protein